MTSDNTPPLRGLIAVVAEDDPSLRRALFFLLQTEGYDVRLFKSAEALLAASLEAADCLIVEDRLPDLSGLETLKRLRRRGVILPAILLADLVDPRLRAEAHEGRFALLEHPFLGVQLIAAVEAATARLYVQ
jgi:FixJ family two-component response regulator